MTGYPAPNYTETPNALFDIDMRDMSESELKVTLAIIRKILGYHKEKPEAISYSQLEEMTGLSRQGVTDGVKHALKRGRIKRAGRGARGISLFTINFADQSTQQTGTSQHSRLELVNEVDTQKKDSKEKDKEKDSTDAPAAVGEAQKQKRKSTPKTLHNIEPIQAVVAYRAFNVKQEQVITGRTMTRINMVVKELRERYTNGSTVQPDELKQAYLWHVSGRGENKKLTAPRDPVATASMLEAYRDIHTPTAPTLSPPDPDCQLCGGLGLYTTQTENGNQSHVCKCRKPLAVAS